MALFFIYYKCFRQEAVWQSNLGSQAFQLPGLDNTGAGKKETRGLRATPEPFFAMAIVC